jgi:hypothetical protein
MKILTLFLIGTLALMSVSNDVRASTEIITAPTEQQPVAAIQPKVVEQSTLAIVSAVMGVAAIIVSVVSLSIGVGPLSWVGFLLGIGATITGFVSKKRINSGKSSGKGFSVIGITTGLTTVIGWIGLTLLAIAALSSWGR